MAEIRNVLKNGGEVNNLTDRVVPDRNVPNVQKSASNRAEAGRIPVGQPGKAAETGVAGTAKGTSATEIASGRDAGQLEAAERLSILGGASATDKLLGLDLRPTMSGALAPPPGNADFLRHLTPAMRRTMMRNMLKRQRERMKKLARFLHDQRDGQENGGEREETFLEAIGRDPDSGIENLERAIDELGRSAGMLDVLDELLALQDFTISQMGAYSQG
ncbi:MAG: hypothetical protein R2684_10825 [Pyrinomonadaceae bacterium]